MGRREVVAGETGAARLVGAKGVVGARARARAAAARGAAALAVEGEVWAPRGSGGCRRPSGSW